MSHNLSQEEIDQLLSDMNNYVVPNKQLELPDNKNNEDKCIFHKWVTYTGLQEVYEHCEICGEKKK